MEKLRALQSGIQTELDNINTRMSTYQDNSEISRFNRMKSGCMAAHTDTLHVTQTALNIAQQSGGAFDPTVAPLIELWGFGRDPYTTQSPQLDDIKHALQHIGYQHIRVQANQLCKSKNALQLNLSAIAKGFAVDQVSRYLESQGVTSFLTEVGGELYAKGKKQNGQAWQVGVETPDVGRRSVFNNTILPVENVGIATSGDYRNYYERDGIRYSHTIDPRTGAPITHSLASVTVVAKNSMLADGHATAIMVLGVQNGLKYAKANNLAAMLIAHDNKGFKSINSPAMQRYLNP